MPALHGVPTRSSAPPTTPGALAKPRRKSGWHTPLGVIIIVFGAFALLGSVGGALAATLMGSIFEGNPDAAATMGAAMGPQAIALNGVAALVAILAICAGAALTRRSPRAARLARLWAWTKIVTVVIVSALAAWIQRQSLTAMVGAQGASQGPPAAFTNIMPIVMLVFSIAWGWALPIVTLCMLSTKSARAETATWANTPPRANA